MIVSSTAINLTVPVVPGDYTTAPLNFGTVNFTHPEAYSSTVVDEIILQFEHPNGGKPAPLDTPYKDFLFNQLTDSLGQGENRYRPLPLYTPPTIEFFRRFDQWFVTVLVDGTGFPFAPFYLYLTHFDRPNRKVYYTRGTLTLSRII